MKKLVMDEQDACNADVKPTKILVDRIRKCYTHRLDGQWEWNIVVWKHETMFADFTIAGANEFATKKEATADMEQTIELLNLVQKPVTKK